MMDSCNGNFLLGYEMPDEILLSIFEHIPDHSLIKIIPMVCTHWWRLSRTWPLWKSRLIRNSISISKDRSQKLASEWGEGNIVATAQWICNYKDKNAFNSNLLKNPSGEDQFQHWKIQHGGDSLIVEEIPIGCDPIPEEAKLPTQHCFVSSYNVCRRSQSVSLCRDFHIKPFVLDVLRPTLCVNEWATARFDCGGESRFTVQAIGRGKSMAVFSKEWRDRDYGRVEWHCVKKKIKYEDLPPKLTTLVFKSSSRDTQFWAGHFGAKTAGSSMILDISKDENIPTDEEMSS